MGLTGLETYAQVSAFVPSKYAPSIYKYQEKYKLCSYQLYSSRPLAVYGGLYEHGFVGHAEIGAGWWHDDVCI